MPRYGPVAMIALAMLQVFLLVTVPAHLGRTVAAAPAPAPEGWSLLVDRIADSPYGLMDPIDSPEEHPNGAPDSPLFYYTDFQPEVRPGQPLQSVPAEQVRQLIKIEASNQGMDPLLIESIVRNESGFNPSAVSPVGAVGLMQLMPETAASLGVDPYNPSDNLRGGVRYFSQQLRRYGGDVSLALAAYNAGPGAVERFGGIPPYTETVNYVDRVIGDYQDARGNPTR